jgi:hypothetical protein
MKPCEVVRRVAADPFQLESQLDIGQYGAPWQQPEFLEHHGAIGAGTGDAAAVDGEVAGIRLDQAEQDVEKGALAAAGRSDDRQELALADVDVEAAQRPHRPAVWRPKGEIDIAAFDIRLHATPRNLAVGRACR